MVLTMGCFHLDGKSGNLVLPSGQFSSGNPEPEPEPESELQTPTWAGAAESSLLTNFFKPF